MTSFDSEIAIILRAAEHAAANHVTLGPGATSLSLLIEFSIDPSVAATIPGQEMEYRHLVADGVSVGTRTPPPASWVRHAGEGNDWPHTWGAAPMLLDMVWGRPFARNQIIEALRFAGWHASILPTGAGLSRRMLTIRIPIDPSRVAG